MYGKRKKNQRLATDITKVEARTILPRKVKVKKINNVNFKNTKKAIKRKTVPEKREKMAESTSIQIDSLINVIQNFDGKKENNIENLINQVEEIAVATDIPDSIRIILIKSKIVGKPKELLLNSAELNNEKNYQIFKNKIIDTFKVQKSFTTTQNEFMELKQLPNQSVDEFEKIFNITAAKYLAESGHENKVGAKDLLNTIKLRKFIEAIRQDIAYEIRKSAPKSYQEAVTIAKQVENALNNKHFTIETEQSNTLCDNLLKLSKSQTDQINELTEKLNKLKMEKQTGVDEAKHSKWCDICKNKSHITDFCWFNKKNKLEKNTKTENFSNISQNYRNFREEKTHMPPLPYQNWQMQNNLQPQNFPVQYYVQTPNVPIQQNVQTQNLPFQNYQQQQNLPIQNYIPRQEQGYQNRSIQYNIQNQRGREINRYQNYGRNQYQNNNYRQRSYGNRYYSGNPKITYPEN